MAFTAAPHSALPLPLPGLVANNMAMNTASFGGQAPPCGLPF